MLGFFISVRPSDIVHHFHRNDLQEIDRRIIGVSAVGGVCIFCHSG
jgi:hypothetical protein